MKIWTDRTFKDRDGNTIWEVAPANGKDDGTALTFGSVIERACNFEHADDKGITFKKKKERFDLGMRCYKPAQQPVEIDTGEAETIKELVARMFNPLVCGQVHQMIEGGEKLPA